MTTRCPGSNAGCGTTTDSVAPGRGREPSQSRLVHACALLALAAAIGLSACDRQPGTDRHSESPIEKPSPLGLIPATEADRLALRAPPMGNNTIVHFTFGGLQWSVPRKLIASVRTQGSNLPADLITLHLKWSDKKLLSADTDGGFLIVYLQSYPDTGEPLVPSRHEKVSWMPISGLEPLGLKVDEQLGIANGFGLIGRQSDFGDNLSIDCSLHLSKDASRREIADAVARATEHRAQCDGSIQLSERLYMRFKFPAEYALEYEQIYDALVDKIAEFTGVK